MGARAELKSRARSRISRRGVSVVEGTIIFAIGGALLAITVPAFVREIHASRFVEPVDGLQKLSSAAVTYAHEKAVKDAFPPTTSLTPSEPPRGARAVDPAGAWDTPTWTALGFRPVAEGVPHLFAFGFDATLTPAKSSFVAHAHGDLDGDGVRSTFEVRGHVAEGDPAGAVIEPGMYVDAEVE